MTIHKRSISPLRSRAIVLGILALSLAGCGESATPPSQPAKTESPAPPPAAPTSKAGKADTKTKNADPTANMDREELKAYKKKMREQGKTF